MFDGIVIDGRSGPGGWRFVDAPEVETIHERGVVLALSTDEVKRLPEPSANAAAMEATPDDVTPDHLRRQAPSRLGSDLRPLLRGRRG